MAEVRVSGQILQEGTYILGRVAKTLWSLDRVIDTTNGHTWRKNTVAVCCSVRDGYTLQCDSRALTRESACLHSDSIPKLVII